MALWLIASAAVVGAPALKERPPSDEDLSKTLVGKWVQDRTPGLDFTQTEEFAADGTWRATSKGNDGAVRLTVTGTWSIRGGALRRVVETCDPPTLRKGQAAAEVLLSVTPEAYRRKSETGREVKMSRLP